MRALGADPLKKLVWPRLFAATLVMPVLSAFALVLGFSGAMLITADHGNAEMMIDPATGGPHTAHTTNPVPIVLTGAGNHALVAEGRLADLAPTLLELMDLPKPPEMTGTSLLRGN